MLSYVFSGRSGLENTSFALLDPEGKKITRGSRSPSMTFGTAERLADALVETAARYEKKAKDIEALPTLRNLRLALNVAAADMRPLVIVRGKDKKDAAKLAERAAKVAWSKDAIGTSHYLVLDEATEFEGLKPEVGVTIVQPDPYGLGGKILAHVKSTAKDKAFAKSICDGIGKHNAEDREHDDHVREARRKGITWESEIPVTDSKGKRSGRDRRRRDD